MMIGYSTTAKAYRLMPIGSNQIIESRDVVFLEETIGYPKNGNSENETALIDEIGVDCSQILAVDNNKEGAEVLEEEQIDSEVNRFTATSTQIGQMTHRIVNPTVDMSS
ncbi:uncharacterized protein LOC122625556 [Drosophila teissieri]|uniref:uncharacterized protein LOC122625556 n=1 Tax=Drosophila teissieri TaxID=7243 RepID=UPI001CBA1FD2|nr:uncharacterized protein LOC122625556 [Drosophila teissieri]